MQERSQAANAKCKGWCGGKEKGCRRSHGLNMALHSQSLLQTRSARCKILLWTLLAEDPGGRRLRECGSQSWQQGVDPVLSQYDPHPRHGFPLLHPGVSVQTSVLHAGGTLCPDSHPRS